MHIFRTKYLLPNTIPLIKPKLHYIIKQSYFGGITEVYKPYGENIKSYDVNSLYPTSMHNFPMPTGKMYHFKNNNLNVTENLIPTQLKIKDPTHGFFKVIVESPENLNTPILPFRLKTPKGVRTTFPLGK